MKRTLSTILAMLLVVMPLSSQAFFGDKDVDKERKELQEARSNALERLYAEQPGTEKELKKAVGYAVFSTLGVNLLLVATERGGGILRDNRDGEDTYMKMFSAGGGLGLGVKDFSVIFVFHTEKAFEEFQTSGWDFSGKAEANAESAEKGSGAEAAATVIPGTSIYQITEAGIALQANLMGTKFWADEDLN